MIIVFTPAGAEPEHYDATTLRVSEVSIVQRTIDQKWGEIQKGLAVEDLDAMRGIVWVIKKRSEPSLRWGDFDPGVTEMVTRMDKQETRSYIDDALRIMAEDPELTREAVMAAMADLPAACVDPEWAEAQIAAAVAEAPKEEPEPPTPDEGIPAPSPSPSPTSSTPEMSTSDSSPTSSTSPPAMSMT
ncbi:hypothetical protein [Streptomyces sp. NPDC002564]|uniref:hypothetical protein n=1 Tax=Streptomyces sp. NPDC002564 TaxID=3364649 RepID=UPI0036B0715D